MSRSVYWKPLEKNQYLNVAHTSAFIEMFERVFGTMPKTLTHDDCDKLNVLFLATQDEVWIQVSDFIKQFSKIEIGVEY